MKKEHSLIRLYQRVKFGVLIFLFTLTTTLVNAQETKKVDVDINADTGGGGFFASPWVWIVGGAVFILLLVALLRGGGSRREA